LLVRALSAIGSRSRDEQNLALDAAIVESETAETRTGRLKVHRFGRLIRIDSRDLDEYIQNACEVAV
jgi:hypothetical protein